jgi:hypothetical protein
MEAYGTKKGIHGGGSKNSPECLRRQDKEKGKEYRRMVGNVPKHKKMISLSKMRLP